MPTDDPQQRQKLLAAIDGWHDQTLTESGALWLKDQLRNDEQARRTFIEYGDMLASLAFTGTAELEEPVDSLLTRALQAEEWALRQSVWKNRILGMLLAVAAALLLAIGFLGFRTTEAPEMAAVPVAPANPIAALPAVAAVSDMYCPEGRTAAVEIIRGAVSTRELPVGTKLLANDELRISDAEMFLELTFASGARLVLQGPAHLVVGTPLSARLKAGRALGFVPPAAIGFALDVPGGVVRDLGTEFAVDAAAGNPHVSVLTGIVECELAAVGEERKSTRLDRGQGVRMDAQAGTFVPLDGVPESLAQIVRYHAGVAAISGEARFVPQEPPLPSEARLISSAFAQIYPERQQVFIQQGENPADFVFAEADGKPTANTSFSARIVRPADEHPFPVDCYFLRVRAPTKKTLVVTGAVTFRQEIVAALTTTEALDATDEILARPEFAAEWKEHPNRARGSDEGADRVTISPDGKTLNFTLQASGANDELRVLVRRCTPADLAAKE